MSINNVEIQDSTGNVYYPHTDASIVKFGSSDVGSALNTTNVNVSNHLADLITDSNGAHGLKIETGTWEPSIQGSTTAGANTYTATAGRYIKENKKITCWFRAALTTKDSAMAGSIRIGGLPYVVANNNANRCALNIGMYQAITIPSGYTNISGEAIPGDSKIALYANGNNIGYVDITVTQISVTTEIRGSIVYETSV